jgi:hypothetical protein
VYDVNNRLGVLVARSGQFDVLASSVLPVAFGERVSPRNQTVDDLATPLSGNSKTGGQLTQGHRSVLEPPK